MRLNQVTLPSRDVAAACDFYRRLGLRLIVDALPRYARFECPDDGTTLSLHLVESARPRGEWPAIYFECDDLDATCARLAAEGIAFESGPAEEPWLWREARLRDPDGNALRLFHAGNNRRFPPWRVG